MKNPFEFEEKEIAVLEADFEVLEKKVNQYKDNIVDKKLYKDKKYILLVTQEDKKKKIRTQEELNELVKKISNLENDLIKDKQFIDTYKNEEKKEIILINKNKKNFSSKEIRLRKKFTDQLIKKNQKLAQQLNLELKQFNNLETSENRKVLEDRRYKVIFEKTDKDSEKQIYEKVENYFKFENLQFLLTNDEYVKFVKKIYSSEGFKNFWKHEIELKKNRCNSFNCEHSKFYSKEIFKNIEEAMSKKTDNQSLFVCKKNRGFHLGNVKKRNFIFEIFTSKELSDLIYLDHLAFKQKEKTIKELKNLESEINLEKEKLSNLINVGLDISDSERIELEILKNNKVFGINSDNKRVEEIFNEKLNQIENKENRIKDLNSKLSVKEKFIIKLYKEDKEKISNLENLGIFESNEQIIFRKDYESKLIELNSLHALLKAKNNELKNKRFDYYSEVSRKKRQNNSGGTSRSFDYYDKNS